MTRSQTEEVVRVCGENYKKDDIPSIWKQHEIKKQEVESGFRCKGCSGYLSEDDENGKCGECVL